MDVTNKTVIFGAGFYGKEALKKIGEDNVICFIDNSSEKQGTVFCDKPVRSPKEIVGENVHVLIAGRFRYSMEQDLISLGISDYSFFQNDELAFYDTDELVVNPYETKKEVATERQWNEQLKQSSMIGEVNALAERMYREQSLFNHIEVETINRCNGSCSFCPVNKRTDPREYALMSEELFHSIVDQLAELGYSGRFTTFSNNEPFLDERIVEFNRYAREKLPKARLHLYTNGTLLSLDKFIAIVEVLDELVIDNYQRELKLIKPCKDIVDYIEHGHRELKKKVTIVLRDPEEILTSRGGTAPNRKEIQDHSNDRCVLPFKQMIIRPDGKVSLCCNDPLGKYTLGDLNKETLLDVWNGPRFSMVRKCLYEGRKNWGNCKNCDTFNIG